MERRRDRARAAVAALLALVLAGWAGPLCAQAPSDQPPVSAPQDDAPTAPPAEAPVPDVVFSNHALSRMIQRGVNMTLVETILAQRKPFRYYHRGHWELGYYDPDSRIFIAMADNVVITVITDVTPRYVAKLKRTRPRTP